MKCKKTLRLLNMYIDNELPEKEKSILQGHLAGCSQCTYKLNEMTRLKELIGAITPYPANPFLWTRVAEGLKEQMPVPIGILVPRILRIWVPVAIVLILFSGFMLYSSEKPVYKPKSLIQTTVLDIPTTPENLEKITLNLLVYTNGFPKEVPYVKF